ncbi:MAG: DUF3857 domain-containing protein [Balneola sp.]|tara:strand:- start:53420 stop:55342 length:1923 start_codon:yes stop_codon:yes gene_type:complete
MKKVFFLTILVVSISCSSNKEIFTDQDFSEEPISTILSMNAHSVIRNSETVVEIVDEGTAYYTVKEAKTIYDKSNKELAELVIFYDQLRKIEYIKANILDKEGKIIKSFTEDDAFDYSAGDGFSFFSDNRVKVLGLYHNSFPYTVEFEYKMKYDGTMFLPTWYPQMPGQSVTKASLKVIDKTGNGVRFFSKNLKDTVKVNYVDGNKELSWDVNFLTAKEREVLGPPAQEILPVVMIAPTKFEIENSYGDASNWKDFGKWYYELGEGSRVLSNEAKREVLSKIEGLTDEKQIVYALYNYLQTKTRYVSIQLGLGGWKPFPAEYVYENEYGDCKALTNYMLAILEEAGIKSNAVLIRNGISSPPMISEFSSNQFNHVILRVELSNGEVIWLECTSKYYPPGHIGGGNEGKEALMISENGGEIIKTPESSEAENVSATLSKIKIDADGTAELEATRKTKGIIQGDILNTLKPISEKAREEWLTRQLNFNDFNIVEASFDNIVNSKDESSYFFKLNLKDYVSQTSSRLFVPLNKLNAWYFKPEVQEKRNQEIWLPYLFTEEDISVFELPSGYEIESIPKNFRVDKNFGNYSVDYSMSEEGEVVLTRKLMITSKRLPADSYDDFRDFFTAITQSDNNNLVLVRTE